MRRIIAQSDDHTLKDYKNSRNINKYIFSFLKNKIRWGRVILPVALPNIETFASDFITLVIAIRVAIAPEVYPNTVSLVTGKLISGAGGQGKGFRFCI